MRNLNVADLVGKSKNFLTEYLTKNEKKLTSDEINFIKGQILKEDVANEEFLKQLEQCKLYKLAGIQLIRTGKAEKFHTALGFPIYFVNIADRLLMMRKIVDIANNKEIKL